MPRTVHFLTAVPLANSVCGRELRRRRPIAARRPAASRLRDCGDLVLLRRLHPGSAAGERTAARFSNRRKSRRTYPRDGPACGMAMLRPISGGCTGRGSGMSLFSTRWG